MASEEDVAALKELVASKDAAITSLKEKVKDRMNQMMAQHAAKEAQFEEKMLSVKSEHSSFVQQSKDQLSSAKSLIEERDAKILLMEREHDVIVQQLKSNLSIAQSVIEDRDSKLLVASTSKVSMEKEYDASIQQIKDELSDARSSIASHVNAVAPSNSDASEQLKQELSVAQCLIEERDAKMVLMEREHGSIVQHLNDALLVATSAIEDRDAKLLSLEGKHGDAMAQLTDQSATAQGEVGAPDKIGMESDSLDVKEQLSSLTRKMKALEEEKTMLQSSSSATIHELLTKSSASEKQVALLTEEVSSSEQEEAKLLKELEVLSEANAEFAREVSNLKSGMEAMEQNLTAATFSNKALGNDKLEAQQNINSISQALKLKTVAHEQLLAKLSDTEAKLLFADSQKNTMESQRSEIIRAKADVVAQLQMKDDALLDALNKLQETEKDQMHALSEVKQDGVQRNNELQESLQLLQSQFDDKVAEVGRLKSGVEELTSCEKTLQRTNKTLQESLTKVSEQLQSELAQSQERKAKLRVYLDNLGMEKQQLEQKLKEKDSQTTAFVEKVKQLENENTNLSSQTIALHQEYKKEMTVMAQFHEQKMSDKEQEVSDYMERINEQSISVDKEVLAAKKLVAESSAEVDSQKSKRMTARHETMKMAQSMEKAQQEGQELKTLFQFTFIPLMHEQTSTVECLLATLEATTGKLAAKSSVKLKARAKDFVSRRSHPRRDSTSSTASNDDEEVDGDEHSPVHTMNSSYASGYASLPSASPRVVTHNNPGISTPDTPSTESSGIVDIPLSDLSTETPSGKNGKRYNNNSVLPNNPGLSLVVNNSNVNTKKVGGTATNGALEQAQYLRNEFERMQAGIVLLTQTVETLQEIVMLDSKWCCIQSNFLSALFWGQSVSRSRPSPGSILGRSSRSPQRNGYTSVQQDF